MGFDWGVRTLLTGAFGWTDHADPTVVRTSGRSIVFDAAGLRTGFGCFASSSNGCTPGSAGTTTCSADLAAGAAPPALVAKREVLIEELRRIGARRRNLDRQVAWGAARWAVEQALAHDATAIYLEYLRSLKAGPRAYGPDGSPGRARAARRNATFSNTVHGQVLDAVRHLAGEHGLAVVTVPPGGTSQD
jgi:hypothetical protein